MRAQSFQEAQRVRIQRCQVTGSAGPLALKLIAHKEGFDAETAVNRRCHDRMSKHTNISLTYSWVGVITCRKSHSDPEVMVFIHCSMHGGVEDSWVVVSWHMLDSAGHRASIIFRESRSDQDIGYTVYKNLEWT